MNIDLTKVLGSAVLLAGAICGVTLNALPVELCYTIAAIVPALWVFPPVRDALKAMVK